MHFMPFTYTVSVGAFIDVSSEALVYSTPTVNSEENLAIVSKTLHTSTEMNETKSSKAENSALHAEANEFDVADDSREGFEWTPTVF